ncbi:MAG: NUDIX domain-containing protein [Desulfobacterales bacterium]|nr:NUDIX domain-containing protein [Desulfobacterales bacterium]
MTLDFRKNHNHRQFTHCPSCGHPGLTRDSIKSFCCKTCGFLFFLNCAAAAMALIIDDKNQLLVTRRKYDPARGSLDLPGGFTEPGDGIEESLKREIKEELNLEVTGLSYLCSFPNLYPYRSVTYPITDMAFTCRVNGFDDIRSGDDVTGFEFIPIPELAPGLFGMASARKVIQYLKCRGCDARGM